MTAVWNDLKATDLVFAGFFCFVLFFKFENIFPLLKIAKACQLYE